jgi:hypothetical protein
MQRRTKTPMEAPTAPPIIAPWLEDLLGAEVLKLLPVELLVVEEAVGVGVVVTMEGDNVLMPTSSIVIAGLSEAPKPAKESVGAN